MSTVGVKGEWTLRERDRRTGLIIVEKTIKNIWTSYGLTALATALTTPYTPPQYLVIESFYSSLYAPSNPGDTVVNVVNPGPTLLNDTQLVLSPGLASQETVTFTSAVDSGSGYTIYTVSGTVQKAHAVSDPVCRQPVLGDSMSSVTNEQQYDAVNAPNTRTASPSGYSGGIGNGVIQFYLPGPSAQCYIMLCGLSDSPTIGQGNLHNHFVLGFNHTSVTTDVEIDGSITLANM